jgi:fatty-acyl-CoA synthase
MRLTRDQSQAVIDRVNQRSLEVAMQTEFTIADRVEELAASQPGATFLIFEEQRISYSEVNAAAEVYARIASSRGVGRGDAVALMMENRPEFFYVWFGMLKLGAKTALLNTEARGKAIEHAVNSGNCRLAFVGKECSERYLSAPGLSGQVPAIEVPEAGDDGPADGTGMISLDVAREGAATEFSSGLRAGLKNSETAAYMFTSGTTGLPKAAYITQSKWLSTGHRWLAMTDLNSTDVFYCVLPIFHGAGLMSMFSTVLALGAPCVLRRKFSASNFWKDIAEHGVTSFIYVGEICRYLVSAPPQAEEKGHKVRIMFGAGMGLDVWQQFTARFGEQLQIYEGWGSTESNCNLSNVENVPGSCGRIPYWDRTFMRVVRYSVENDMHPRGDDGYFQIAGPGEAGELLGQIQMGDGTPVSPFDGYSDDAATSKKILCDVFEAGDRWFRTGDLFRYDEEGYFFFVDRVGDTYRWKSENVSTTEVAQQLSDYAAAELINIYGVRVPNAEGRAGMAAIGMAVGKRFDPVAFYEVAVSKLAPYAVPLFVRVVAQMDITGTYKLRKVELQAQGYDPEHFDDELFLLDHAAHCYSPYSEQGLKALGCAPFAAAEE